MSSEKTNGEGKGGIGGFVRRFVLTPRFSAFAVVVALGVGVIVGVPTVEGVDRYLSSDAFCASSCHFVEATVTKELHQSSHWTRKSGVRATCSDCHISENLLPAMWDHFVGMRDLYAFVFKGIRTVEDFEKVRFESANRVRLAMVAEGSKNCQKCHVMEAIKPERKRGQKQHAEAIQEKTACIACHYNLVHKEAKASEAFLRAIGE